MVRRVAAIFTKYATVGQSVFTCANESYIYFLQSEIHQTSQNNQHVKIVPTRFEVFLKRQ